MAISQKNKSKTKKLTSTVSSIEQSNNNTTVKPYTPTWVVISQVNEAIGYDMELIDRIRDGVTKTDWKQLINEIGHTEKELEYILPASISSMQKKSIYGKETSERIYELAKLYRLGYKVFDTKEDFRTWLMSPSRSLSGKKPFELLDSSFGFQVVQNAIIRIQYNVYS